MSLRGGWNKNIPTRLKQLPRKNISKQTKLTYRKLSLRARVSFWPRCLLGTDRDVRWAYSPLPWAYATRRRTGTGRLQSNGQWPANGRTSSEWIAVVGFEKWTGLDRPILHSLSCSESFQSIRPKVREAAAQAFGVPLSGAEPASSARRASSASISDSSSGRARANKPHSPACLAMSSPRLMRRALSAWK